MPTYETITLPMGQTVIARTNDDGSITSFFADPANSDYQAYLAYVANGNKLPSNSSTPQAGA
jgi:hypothetical protein